MPLSAVLGEPHGLLLSLHGGLVRRSGATVMPARGYFQCWHPSVRAMTYIGASALPLRRGS
jgi:hypothetical protein